MNPARGMVIRRTRTHKSDTLAAHDNGEQASHSVQRNDDGTILQAWPARQTRHARHTATMATMATRQGDWGREITDVIILAPSTASA